MKSINEKLSLAVIGLIIAGLGIVSPIAWDWWKQKSQLTVQVTSIVAVVSNKNPINGLEFTYAGKKVDYLTQLVLRVENTGRTPIAKSEVVAPLVISVVGGELFEARISKKYPDNMDASLNINGDMLEFDFSLLNSGESFEVIVLTTANNPSILASARIKNISNVDVVRQQTGTYSKVDSIIAYVAMALMSLFSISLSYYGCKELQKQLRASKSMSDGSARILHAVSLQEAQKFASSDVGFLTTDRLKLFNSKVSDAAWPLNEEKREAFAVAAKKVIWQEQNLIPLIVIIFIGVSAIYYLFTRTSGFITLVFG